MEQQQGKLTTLRRRYYYFSHFTVEKIMLREFENIPKIHIQKEAQLRESDSRVYTYSFSFFFLPFFQGIICIWQNSSSFIYSPVSLNTQSCNHYHNHSMTSKTSPKSLCTHFSTTSSWQLLVYFLSIIFVVSRMLYKWKYADGSLLNLASFIMHLQ